MLSWGNAWDSRWCRAQLSWKACPAEQHAPWPGRNQCNSSEFCWNSLRRVFLADKLGNSMTIKCADLQGCPCVKKARAWHRDCLYPGNCGMRTRYHSLILSTQSVSNIIKYIQIWCLLERAMVKSSSSPGPSGKRGGSDLHCLLLWKFSAFGCPGGTGGGKRHPASAKGGAGGFAKGWAYSAVSWDFRTWMGTWTSIPIP